MTQTLGLDISHFQNKIDWKKVKKAGIKFAVLKCSEGNSYKDPTFETNRAEARKNGILVGAYHFCRGGDNQKEVDWFLKCVGDIQTDEFLALDFEIQIENPEGWCRLWLDKVSKIGFRPLIYMNASTVASYNWRSISNDYGLWEARYGVNNGKQNVPPATVWWKNWAMWQYTSRGTVDGITGNVDMNVFNGTLDQLRKYGKPQSPQSVATPEIVPEPQVDVSVAPTPSSEATDAITIDTSSHGINFPGIGDENTTLSPTPQTGSYTAEPQIEWKGTGWAVDNTKPTENPSKTLWELIKEYFQMLWRK